LAAGAIIRTVDKTGNVAEARGARGGSGYGQASASGQTAEGAMLAGRGRSGETRTGTGVPVVEASVDEWLTLQGTVTEVTEDSLVVQTAGGEQILVENRPWWFAQEQGFSAAPGDQVTLVGFYEDDSFEVGQMANSTNSLSVVIRDETGRPMWAGRGRQGG
jgi:hypothetical protein